MAGIYFRMAGTVVELSGYLRVGGPSPCSG